jgi:hypothetical protein
MLLALVTTALAASNEVDLEVGLLGSGDPTFDRVSEGDVLATYGLRVGVKLHQNVAAIAGWQHGQTGSQLSTYGDTDYDGSGTTSLRAAYFGDVFTLGAKGDIRVNEWFYPYVTVQGALERGLVRVDDDASTDENIGQVKQAGVTGGFVAAVGAESPVALGDGGVAIAPYVEVGYGWLAPLQLGDMGSLKLGGVAARVGLGVRF